MRSIEKQRGFFFAETKYFSKIYDFLKKGDFWKILKIFEIFDRLKEIIFGVFYGFLDFWKNFDF